ncbi:carbohydrate kinase family protein [Glycomyces tritici]|uniref:Carbohydrate kinase n=1 Tax=Glycomyces tritici TaxID=2665176 RepID=A0ABT7YTF2_9ACTN|nr:carbohydrate kinase [Glycomyces tritici]MDN3241548.1 carbohydrate kinase [Glycomyces tritici]MDN3242335.1 carbohydrate kinase [Glycomyces tritici]
MIGVIGEALIDLKVDQEDARHPVAHPGGSPMNVAVALGRLGAEVAFLGRLSGDAFGKLLRTHLAESDVHLQWIVDAPEPTSLAIVSVDPGGSASYAFHVEGTADWQWAPTELPPNPGLDAVHAGSLALAVDPGGPVIARWLEELSARTTISLDPNVRPALLGDREAYRARLERWLGFAAIVKVSDEDLAWIWPGTDPADHADAWIAEGRKLVVITRGGEGSLVRTGGASFAVPAAPVDMVDTVGAGDSFSGALLDWLGRNGRLRPDDLARLTASEAREAVEFAAKVAAITCSRAGANPPYRSEM